MKNSDKKALDGIKVVELSRGRSASMCGKALADYGADVILIEPKTGHETRLHGPFPNNISHPEKSLQFIYLHGNKRSKVLDLDKDADNQSFLSLLKQVDLFICDLSLTEASNRNLDFETIQNLNGNLIGAYITPFGQVGPYKDYAANELILWHMGGLGYESPAFTVTDLSSQPPLKSGGYNAEYFGGWTAATACMAAITHREITGKGQMVDVAVLESVMNHIRGNFAMASHDISLLPENRLKSFFTWIWPCKDGHVSMSIHTDHWWTSLIEEMGNPEWALNPDFETLDGRKENFEEIEAGIYEWMSPFSKTDLYQKLSGKGIPCFPVYSTSEILESPHYRARDFFVEQKHPVVGPITQPGPSIRMKKTPWSLNRPAPLLNQHSNEIDLEFRNLSKNPITKNPGNKKVLPLKGIRVLDMGWILSVPHCGGWLGALGAEVIEIESRASLDLTRRGPEINKNAAYNGINYSKKGFNVNLKTEKGLKLFKELASISDVVIENFATDVMNNLGCGYNDLVKHNPDLIMVSGSTLGVEGPQRQASGFGPNVSSYAGLPFLSGYENGPPLNMGGNWPDYLVGTMMVFSIISALRHRGKTGEGQYIEFSMAECVSSLLPEAFMEMSVNGTQQKRYGNRHLKYAPHNVYPSHGFDKWVAISCTDEGQWQAFCKTSGNATWLSDQRFATNDLRKQNEDILDDLIAQWTKELPAEKITEDLQKVGVPSGPIMDVIDLMNDPHVIERGYLVDIPHPEVGTKTTLGLPVRMSGIDQFNYKSAPLFGEHNKPIFTNLLGNEASVYEEFVRDKIIY